MTVNPVPTQQRRKLSIPRPSTGAINAALNPFAWATKEDRLEAGLWTGGAAMLTGLGSIQAMRQSHKFPKAAPYVIRGGLAATVLLGASGVINAFRSEW